MRRRQSLGFLGLALLGLGLYRFRRHLLGYWLGLRPHRHAVTVRRGLKIAMPDGVQLAADHYAPSSTRLYPTVLIRTPYGRSQAAGLSGVMPDFIARRFAERGYNVLVQDVRGRFDSQGEFEPFVHEESDGRTTLDWLEKQAWFNGVLGMWGQSYLGYVQWAIAPGAPLYLKALLPAVTGSQLPQADRQDGALGLDMLLRWFIQMDDMDRLKGRTGIFQTWRFNAALQERRLQRAARRLPLGEADQVATGRSIPYYQDVLRGLDAQTAPTNQAVPSPRVKHLTAAVHLVSGWQDFLLRQLLADYEDMRLSGQHPYLTIGPWNHLDLECLWETLRQGLTWFDACLKGDRSGLRENPVRIYVMGKNQWREMESWPPFSNPVRYYLHAAQDGRPACSGRLLLDAPAESSPPDTYTYDPAHPTPSLGGALMTWQGGVVDNRTLEKRADVITYTSSILEKELEIIGPVQLVLYVRSSLEYTDFFARLCDVTPAGRSLNVCDGLLRLRPGLGVPQPDGSLRLQVELWPTAYCFLPGHCLRLQVSSGAHPRWNRNLGTGEPVLTGVRMLKAEQTLYHDQEHPAELILPGTEEVSNASPA
ncbi:MAG: CocE/NonD family hydrolase [Anaerolineales bacterium]|nr:CocE/NonD family hydrolase [Anaerolineales bacterium]